MAPMIEAPAQPDVTLSRKTSDERQPAGVGSRQVTIWRVTFKSSVEAPPATCTSTASDRTEAVQPNKLGNYHCRSGEYDVLTGRCTTPDGLDGLNLFNDEEAKKKKCCCAKDLNIYPSDAKSNPNLEGGKEMKDYWGKIFDDAAAAAKAEAKTAKEAKEIEDAIKASSKLIYGADGKKLGKEDVKTDAGEYVLFKFQSVGEVEWVEWDGASEPDCTFDQKMERTNPDGTKVAKKSDFETAGQDPNTDAGSTNAQGQPGVRVKLGDNKYSWVDPVITDYATNGKTTREFEMTLSSAKNCPCKQASITKNYTLVVDTSKKPADVTWTKK